MRWPPYENVIFDCDSTLTTVEGIDALARAAGKGWRVSILTEAAMNGEIELGEVYSKRLLSLKPTRGQIHAIRQIYKQNLVEDAREVISALKYLGHQVYIISGGLAEPVREFGHFLGVPRDHIRAVDVEYDQLSGNWWQRQDEQLNVEERYLDHLQEPLTLSDGKAQVIEELLAGGPGRSILIGDGVSDLLAGRAVDVFVGFGRVVSRPRVKTEAPIFISSSRLAPLISIASGPARLAQLDIDSYNDIYEKACNLIHDGAITFQGEELNERFKRAWNATY